MQSEKGLVESANCQSSLNKPLEENKNEGQVTPLKNKQKGGEKVISEQKGANKVSTLKVGPRPTKKPTTPLKNQSLLMNFIKPALQKEEQPELKNVESEGEILPPSSKSNPEVVIEDVEMKAADKDGNKPK